jgi:hypothetical protein
LAPPFTWIDVSIIVDFFFTEAATGFFAFATALVSVKFLRKTETFRPGLLTF